MPGSRFRFFVLVLIPGDSRKQTSNKNLAVTAVASRFLFQGSGFNDNRLKKILIAACHSFLHAGANTTSKSINRQIAIDCLINRNLAAELRVPQNLPWDIRF